MAIPVRVLIVEDSEDDALIILRRLKQGGFDPESERVDTPEDIRNALRKRQWDLVLSDFALPGFDGRLVLDLVHEAGLDVPFIVISGTIGEEQAVSLMKSGAHDYILKDSLGRLVPAIERELKESELRRQKKAQEAAIRESERFLQTVINGVAEPIVVISADYRVLMFNQVAGELYGVSVGDACHEATHGFHRPCNGGKGKCPMGKIRETGLPVMVVHEHTDREGRSRQIEVLASPYTDSAGKFLGIIESCRDITERLQAEQSKLEMERKMLQTQKLESLGLLAGGIAHDFNNLLMAILGNLDLSLMKISPHVPGREFIQNAVTAAHRSADLTRQLLAYSGRGKFTVMKVSLNRLVEENADIFRAAIDRTINLNLLLGEKLPLIEADPSQIQQVIMNLITNASEAIGQRAGKITLTTAVEDCSAVFLRRSLLEEVPPAGKFVSLNVTDTGCGMDRETVKRIFDPFFTTKVTGRGLGMSAVLGIVRSHRGAIMIDSSPGKGTSITILLPVQRPGEKDKSSDQGLHAPGVAEPAEKLGGTVLIADDEEMIRNVSRAMVEAAGLVCLTAANGEEAVDVFRRNAERIDCVILDLSMPKMDGLAAAAEIRKMKAAVPVVVASGYHEQDAAGRFGSAGLAGFIHKPYTMENLLSILRRVLKAPPGTV